jgi:quinol monooxygenase YgiN
MVDHTVFELRRYRLRPNTRDALIATFDHALVETQESTGICVVGQFRDLDDPDAFVWVRSFADMDARGVALQTFYTSPSWAENRSVANATMVNSDNVLLLRPTGSAVPFARMRNTRPPRHATAVPPGLVVVTSCSLAPGTEGTFADDFEHNARPLMEAAGARIDATFATDHSPNSFPRLPIREGEPVFIWFASFADEQAYERFTDKISRSATWIDDVFPLLDGQVWRKMEVARLKPTARSLYTW